MSELQDIARTVSTLAVPGMKPKDLVDAVRKQHPDTTKKQISRAAFLAMILAAEGDPSRAQRVQALALAARSNDTDEGSAEAAPRRKKKKKARHAAA